MKLKQEKRRNFRLTTAKWEFSWKSVLFRGQGSWNRSSWIYRFSWKAVRLIPCLKTVAADHLQALPRDTCSVCIFKMATQFIRFAGCSECNFFGGEQRLASLGVGKCAHRGLRREMGTRTWEELGVKRVCWKLLFYLGFGLLCNEFFSCICALVARMCSWCANRVSPYNPFFRDSQESVNVYTWNQISGKALWQSPGSF